MTSSPIQIFNSAYDRAESFLLNNVAGKKAKDDLRAAVVFVVAAIDAYFSVKIVAHLKKERERNSFKASIAAQKLIKDVIGKKNFGKDFKDLTKEQKELVVNTVDSNKPSLIAYLENSIVHESFQSVEKIDEAFKIMGKIPQEMWNKIDSAVKSSKTTKKKKAGRPIRKKRGRKVDMKTQLNRLFEKRNLIVHEADIILRGRKSVGDERQISYENVKKWLNASQKSIKEIDRIVK